MKEYVIFIGQITPHEILKEDKKNGYILYYDDEYQGELWERIEYIEKRFKR